MVECITNPNCEMIEDCNKKINATMAMEQAKGLTRYVCGRIPCEYSNQVSHPSHYNKDGRKECIVEMEEYSPVVAVMYCLTSAYKYLYRAGEKFGNPSRQEIDKAKWCFDYTNKLIDKHNHLLSFNGMRIEHTDLYLDIKEMLGNE